MKKKSRQRVVSNKIAMKSKSKGTKYISPYYKDQNLIPRRKIKIWEMARPSQN